MSFPMYLIITKPNIPKYDKLSFVCDSLDMCENKLITIIKPILLHNIDYPSELDDFAYLHWYKNNNMDNPVFDYEIYIDGKWQQPWSLQDIYTKIIDIIYNVDIQNCIYNNKNYYDYDSDNEDD